MNWIVALTFVVGRLKEPSSYAGLGLVLGGLHLCQNCDALSSALVPVFLSLAGLAAFFLPESK